jgi:glutaminyl-tRNA synthetase
VKGTIHWVSAAHAIDAECRLYDRLFTEAEPESASAKSSGATGGTGDFKQFLNQHSLEVVTAKCEPSLKDAEPELRYQFERLGYFALDKDSSVGSSRCDDRTAQRAVPTLIFNRTITLKDTWAKETQKG